MSLSTTASRNLYTGNGATSTYAYSWKIFDATELQVRTYVPSTGVYTTLTYNVDYTVTGVGVAGGGNVVLTAGSLASATVLLIRRVPSLTQTLDIRNQGTFFPANHEDQFDKLVMMVQYLQDQLNLTVKMDATSSYSGLTLPSPSSEKYLRWKDDLTGLENANVQAASDKAGVETLSSGDTSKAVLFSSSMSNTNYAVSISFENTTDGDPIVPAWIVTTKSTTGFTVKWTQELPSANYKLNWSILRNQ